MTKATLALATMVSAIALSYAPIASAQQSATVTVDVSSVASTVAKNLNVDAAKIPSTIQVPVALAATVCGVPANVLTQQGGTGVAGACQAKSTSSELDQLIQKGVAAQK